MLKKIQRIQKLGIFDDYTVEANFNDFARFNLFYGWNGCGKTTLSRLFSMLAKKQLDESFEDCEFEVHLTDGTAIKSNNLAAFNHKVFVFNQQFIQEHIDWQKQGAKLIVIISSEKIQQRDAFLELKNNTVPAKDVEVSEKRRKIAHAEDNKEKFLSSTAKTIKLSFQLIDTTDRYYMNYDKGKTRSFIEQNAGSVQNPSSILSIQQLEELNKKVKPIFKDPILINLDALDIPTFINKEKEIISLLPLQVTTTVIDRLKQHQDINNWVQEGLELHHKHQSANCEFCSQIVPAGRLQDLNRHFSDEYVSLVNRLNEMLEWLENVSIPSVLPDQANIYDEFRDAYLESIKELTTQEKALSFILDTWKEKLQEKSKNIFAANIAIVEQVAGTLEKLEAAKKLVVDILGKHNAKAGDFAEQVKKDKQQIELHYVALAVQEQDYFGMLKNIDAEQTKLKDAEEELAKLIAERTRLEGELANAAQGAEEFNAELHRFLGRNDISLVYDGAATAYKIMRAGSNKPANNLSEGEKTAIAFVYFSIKIRESANKIEDSIILVDDPISSFDSTYLFNSFAYLKYTCEKAAQLFVLTHNFQYFKLVRDWMTTKNKYDKPVKSRIYSIDVLKKTPRQSVLNNAHSTLINHQSEYHFFFKKLYGFKVNNELTLDESFQVANYARKMLEAFFSFKRPKKRTTFYQLMIDGCAGHGIDEIVMHKVFKFINAYSHNQIVEFHDSSADNLLSEGYNVTADVLSIMEKVDKVHYDELVEESA